MEKNINIESVKEKFKKYCEEVGDPRFSFDINKDSDILLCEIADEDFLIDNNLNPDDRFNICSIDENTLTKLIERSYERFMEIYNYYEYDYGRFGPRNYLIEIDPSISYLCGLYFEEIGEKEKANDSYFVGLCENAYVNSDFEESPWFIKELKLKERIFDDIKDKLYPDFLTTHPYVTYVIGKYFILEEKYDKAFEWFSLGASFDYDGRQSIEPFIAVGHNQFELGKMYLYGQGVEKDYDMAYDLFASAAKNAGQDYIPIMGDMYFEGLGVDKDLNMALLCYTDFNTYNKYNIIPYRKLTEKQKERLSSLVNKVLSKKNIRFEDLKLAYLTYQNQIYDKVKGKEVYDRMVDYALATPLDKRNDYMNELVLKYNLDKVKDSLKKPLRNVGNIPSSLKPGDIFTFGNFNGEDLTWKVLEKNSDGSFYVVSTKIIVKMNYEMAPEWLNDVFYNYSFTEEEKKHIVSHEYSNFLKYEETHVYIPQHETFLKYEGDYLGNIEETKLASSLSNNKDILCFNAEILEPVENKKGNGLSFISMDTKGIYCIRPAMDIIK